MEVIVSCYRPSDGFTAGEGFSVVGFGCSVKAWPTSRGGDHVVIRARPRGHGSCCWGNGHESKFWPAVVR